MKPTYRRSWAGNLLMFSDLTLDPSFKVRQWFTGFGELSFRWIQICIGSPMRRSSLLLVLEVCNVKPTKRKSWAGNLLILSDLTFGHSLKVKRWFTGFDELSFCWIQIYIGSPIRRSSFKIQVLPLYNKIIIIKDDQTNMTLTLKFANL